LQKLFKGANYSSEETILVNSVCVFRSFLFVLSDCRPLPPCPDNIDVRSQTEYIPGKTCKIAPQPVELPPKEKWRLTATPDQIKLVDSARENGNIQFYLT
jgi:hypothetical protein